MARVKKPSKPKRNTESTRNTVELWPAENVTQLIEHVHINRQDFVQSNYQNACADAALVLPTNPRTGRKYLGVEISKKLGYLRNGASWDVVAREGMACLTWRRTQQKATERLVDTQSATKRDAATRSIRKPVECNSDHSQLPGPLPMAIEIYATSPAPTPTRPDTNIQFDMTMVRQFESAKQDNYEYLTSTANRHVMLDDRVKDGMQKIFDEANMLVASLSETLDFSNLPYPQFDAIEVLCPATSTLLHKALGLPEGRPPSLNHKLGLLGLGRLSLTDWLHALIGSAIQAWVFRSSFPTSLTRPDKSLGMLKDLLNERGLKNLKENMLSDLRYRNLEAQRPEFPQRAATLADSLAIAIEPMFVRHNVEDPYIGAPNINQAGEVWGHWHTQMAAMWLTCLRFKASLELDSGFFEYKWPKAGSNFDKQWMECNDRRRACEGRRIYVTLLPAIVAKDRNGLVLSKAIVVLGQ